MPAPSVSSPTFLLQTDRQMKRRDKWTDRFIDTSAVMRTASLKDLAPVAPIMNSCIARRLPACEPPLITFIHGTVTNHVSQRARARERGGRGGGALTRICTENVYIHICMHARIQTCIHSCIQFKSVRMHTQAHADKHRDSKLKQASAHIDRQKCTHSITEHSVYAFMYCAHMCMYVCLYLCMMYVSLYACMFECMCVCMCVCVSLSLSLCMYVCMYVCVYARMRMYVVQTREDTGHDELLHAHHVRIVLVQRHTC